jgi:hypothetical protein
MVFILVLLVIVGSECQPADLDQPPQEPHVGHLAGAKEIAANSHTRDAF